MEGLTIEEQMWRKLKQTTPCRCCRICIEIIISFLELTKNPPLMHGVPLAVVVAAAEAELQKWKAALETHLLKHID